MKSFNLSKVVGASALIASLATLPLALPASAQNGTVTDSNQAAPGDIANYGDGDLDRGERTIDWGWIGLLGLLGLAGRLAKHREETVRYSQHNEINHVSTTEESVRFKDPNETNRFGSTEESVRYKDPSETNRFGSTEESVRYKDPNETNRFGSTEESVRYKDPNQ